MSIDVKVYDNGDHTCLVWLPTDGKAIANCRGFTIHRSLKANANAAAQDSYLHGFVGFSDTDKLDPNATWKFPVQRYMWWDYGVAPGNIVQYSVVPVVGPDKDHLTLSPDASAMTPPMTITGQASAHISAYFNKGIVSAQWVSRDLAALGKKPNLNTLITTVNNPLRNALSGLLRPQLLDLLDEVKNSNGEIYAALYELNDPELIAKLVALGQKCHLILANGAFKPPTNDENAKVRAQLHGKVDLHNRLVSSGHFAHNKFVVACDSVGNPQRVLSGSTNWTSTGLCTQANNSIIVNDAGLGAHFIKEWNLLKAAGNSYPSSLMQANSKSQSFAVDGGTITQWFAPTDKGEDLDYARQLINGAQQGILFLFFNPGVFEPDDKPEMWTLLQNILVRHQQGTPNYNPNLYIHGVVNQEIAGLTTEDTRTPKKHAGHNPTTSPVTLYDGGKTPPLHVSYEFDGAQGDQRRVPRLERRSHESGRPRSQQGHRHRSVRQKADRHDRIAQSGAQGLDRERRQSDDRRGQCAAGGSLCHQHHRHLPDLPLEHLCRRARKGPEGLAWAHRRPDLAERLSRPRQARLRRDQVLARRRSLGPGGRRPAGRGACRRRHAGARRNRNGTRPAQEDAQESRRKIVGEKARRKTGQEAEEKSGRGEDEARANASGDGKAQAGQKTACGLVEPWPQRLCRPLRRASYHG